MVFQDMYFEKKGEKMKIKTLLIALFISVFGLSSSSVLADAESRIESSMRRYK